MLQAKIQLKYSDQTTASAVALAISPDNITVPAGLTVTTCQAGREVVTDIFVECKLATFISTIDDLLEAASTAEKALRIVKPN